MNEEHYRCPTCGKLLTVIAAEEYGDFNSYIAACPGDCHYQTELSEDMLEVLEALQEKEAGVA